MFGILDEFGVERRVRHSDPPSPALDLFFVMVPMFLMVAAMAILLRRLQNANGWQGRLMKAQTAYLTPEAIVWQVLQRRFDTPSGAGTLRNHRRRSTRQVAVSSGIWVSVEGERVVIHGNA